MKAKQYQDGTIKIGLPKFYHGVTGTYLGDFHLRGDEIHEQEGFFPVVIPSYNQETQHLGELYFDVSGVFTYAVHDIVFDLEQLRQERLHEFSAVIDEFAQIISRCRLIHGDNEEGLNSAIEQTRLTRMNTINAIKSIATVDEMLAFRIREEDVEGLRMLFLPYL